LRGETQDGKKRIITKRQRAVAHPVKNSRRGRGRTSQEKGPGGGRNKGGRQKKTFLEGCKNESQVRNVKDRHKKRGGGKERESKDSLGGTQNKSNGNGTGR